MLQQYCFIHDCDINFFTWAGLATAKTIMDVIAALPYARFLFWLRLRSEGTGKFLFDPKPNATVWS